MQHKRHQMDYVLFFTVIILSAVGVLTVYSASTVISLQNDWSASHFAVRQLFSGVLGVAFLIAVSLIPHQLWYRFAVPFMFGSLVLLFAVLFIGSSANGGRRWIGSGTFHLQPSEISIIATVMYLAFFFTKKITLVHNFKRGLLPGLIVAGINFAMIFLEPDMGTALTLLSTALVMVLASGARLRPLLILAGALAPIIVGLALLESYRSDRITAWINPFHDTAGIGYQLLQGWTAISEGGWFGRGFGMSIQKMGYLPYSWTDFIFPIFVEEWGFIGAIALLAVFGVLIWRGFIIARHCPDRFSALLSVGLTSMIALKTFINVGAVTGLMPVTGIPLPFISYGGTSLVVNMLAMGMLLSISRSTLDVEPEEDQLAEVIAVEDVKQLRTRRSSVGTKPPGPFHEAPTPRSAQVHVLRKDKDRKRSNEGSWRARQETATTRSHASRSAQSTAPVGRTWRERNQSQPGSPNSGVDKSRKGPRFRKDR